MIRKMMTLQSRFIRDLETLLASGHDPRVKTIEAKLERARNRLDDLMVGFEKEYAKALNRAYREGVTRVAKELKTAANFNAVSAREIERLRIAGLQFMENYRDDMIRRIKTELYLSFMNGESYLDAYERIRPLGNNRARPKVMIRDQMARTYQSGIIEGYGAAGNPQDYDYYWTGPEDERTTDICEDRKRGNPYSWDDVKELETHPHIQCRHRWVAKPNVA